MPKRTADAALKPWSPPTYRVDANGKVEGATPGQINNWDKWGDSDQVGTMNYCTPDRVAAAASLIRTGKRFSLGLPIGRLTTPSARPDPIHFLTSAAGDAVLGDNGFADEHSDIFGDKAVTYHVSDDHVVLALQHTTQLDGFGFGIDDTLYNGYWAGLVTAKSGARRLGMQNRANGYVGRAILVDLARHLGVPRLEDEFRITTDLIEEVLAAQGATVQKGDILLFRSGYLGWWLGSTEAEKAARRTAPGLSASIVPWLHEHEISMVALDASAIEVVSSREPAMRMLEFHIRGLRDLGLGIGETFDLDELAEDCAEDGQYECFCVIAPLPVQGGCGSPLNPVVIK